MVHKFNNKTLGDLVSNEWVKKELYITRLLYSLSPTHNRPFTEIVSNISATDSYSNR